jgi:hypothetical protein
MGLPTWCRRQLRMRYAQCFTYDAPTNVQCVSIDEMQFIKGELISLVGQGGCTIERICRYIINTAVVQLDAKNACHVVFLNFDGTETPPVKKLVCHTERYERRCKLCKKVNGGVPVPRGKRATEEFFSSECTSGCIDDQVFWYEDGPHLPQDESQPFSFTDWTRFMSDSRNLYSELYPRIYNYFLDNARFTPKPGQMVFLSGLPAQMRLITEHSDDAFSTNSKAPTKRYILHPWSLEQLPLQYEHFDFNHVIVIEGIAPCERYPRGHVRREEVPEMKNEIQEADNRIFYWKQFFPNYNHLCFINDGDAISIGLLRVVEDFYGGDNPVHEQWLAMPFKDTSGNAFFAANELSIPRIEYINLSMLYQKVEATPEFLAAGVQSPVATLVFLLILSETDFFKGEFARGIGKLTEWSEDEAKRAKQTYGVWDTMFQHLSMFSHLVQYYPGQRDPKAERRIVIDEDLFRIFTFYCYDNKYGPTLARKLKVDRKDISIEQVRSHCSKLKDPSNRMPSDGKIQRWARQILYNGLYWLNAPRNIFVDPFEEFMDRPYFGYDKELGIVDNVSPKQKPVDEVYKRHFYKRRQKRKPEPISDKRKADALALIRGK